MERRDPAPARAVGVPCRLEGRDHARARPLPSAVIAWNETVRIGVVAVRDLFPEFHELTPDELEELWTDGTFVLDANVLLDLYRWSEETREDMIHVLRVLAEQGRLWLPHQAGIEYYRNRPQVIAEAASAYDAMLKGIAEQRRSLKKPLETERHPFVSTAALRRWDDSLGELEAQLKERQSQVHSLKSVDPLKQIIQDIFNDKVGKPFDQDTLAHIAEIGASRYRRSVPPGYLDAHYASEGAATCSTFGDLIIWFQMIEKAKRDGKPIIFVTGDLKEDWWWIAGGRRIGPRPELIAEMHGEAGIRFHMYSPHDLLAEARERLEIEVEEETLEEVARLEAADLTAPITSAQAQQMLALDARAVQHMEELMRAAQQMRMGPVEEAMRAAQQMRMGPIGEAMRAAQQMRMGPIWEAMRAAQQMRMGPIWEAMRAVQQVRMGPIEEAMRAAQQMRMGPIWEAMRTVQQMRMGPVEEAMRAVQQMRMGPIKDAMRAARQTPMTDVEEQADSNQAADEGRPNSEEDQAGQEDGDETDDDAATDQLER